MRLHKRSDSVIQKRRGRRKKRVCNFCVDKITSIDYKEIGKLRKFISERGKILPRRVTGNCAKHQRAMTVNVKRARHMALMPYTSE
ncbi:MAG: 30S ribosomal protein S18 [Defluviitaleaceae bacterium]|nr:30S ribosomal protein S18 [Defluviitaleaceae bacterium]